MTITQFSKLSFKLTLPIVVIGPIVVLLLFLLLKNELNELHQKNIALETNNLVDTLVLAAEVNTSPSNLTRVVNSLAANHNIVDLRLVARDSGIIVADSKNQNIGKPISTVFVERNLKFASKEYQVQKITYFENVAHVSRDVNLLSPERDRLRLYRVYLDYDISDSTYKTKRLLNNLIFFLIIAMLSIILAGLMLQNILIFKPLRLLSNTIREQRKSKVLLLSNIKSNDEIGVLSKFYDELSQERSNILQDLRREKETAESANESKSTFLSMMSHEIRTPMTGLLGMADILEKTDLTDEQKHYLHVIQRSGNTLMVVINDVLDHSKMESGNFELTNYAFDLHALINDVTITYQANLIKGVEFFCSLDPNVPKIIYGDEVRLHQVINNLLNNAFKFTSSGKVSLIVSRVERNNSSSKLKFSFEDTGIGMDAESLKVIFQSYSQVTMDSSKNSIGTGLGLSICKKLIEMMGGYISVESELGKGSIFTVTIDEKVYSELNVGHSNIENKKYSDFSVLLVEDNIVNREVISAFMKRLNVKFESVPDGEAAITFIQSNRKFDLIFMDCELPGISGYEATQAIRIWEADANKNPVTICALSANVFQEDILKCEQAGMDHHLSKPIIFDEIQSYLGSLAKSNT